MDGARRDHVTRIPNAALSFTPSPHVLEAAKQKPPAPLSRPIDDRVVSMARVWEFDGTEFTPIPVRTGLADDRWTELVAGRLQPGLALITKATTGASGN
jgi:hypothetical protein